MSTISDGFIERNFINRVPPHYVALKETRSTFTPLSSYNSIINPRQREFYEMTSRHQSNLNHLHFLHKIGDGDMINAPNVEVSYDSDHESFHLNANEIKNKTDNPEVNKYIEEERELERILQYEKELYDETSSRINNEIEKVKKLIEQFRYERIARLNALRLEYSDREAHYVSDIERLKRQVILEPEIHISYYNERPNGLSGDKEGYIEEFTGLSPRLKSGNERYYHSIL